MFERVQSQEVTLALSMILTLCAGLSSQVYAAGAEERNLAGSRQQQLFKRFEQQALQNGWIRLAPRVNGLERQLMWKSPGQSWKNGAIIVLHGGGGTYSNYAANLPIGKPMVDFAQLALQEGFAVISPDSTNGLASGVGGISAGKRWDCLAKDSGANIDLPFLETIATKIIPELRPAGSSKSVFLTGISNGGFMTILAATHLGDKITAFAPVSAGDPYGTYLKCDELAERTTAPGIFHDNETSKPISEKDAAIARVYAHEKKWPTPAVAKKAPFKQFQHQLDSGVDVSCMEKATRQLKQHGYADDGCFLLKATGAKRLLFHFWRPEYNRPLLEFFKKNVADAS